MPKNELEVLTLEIGKLVMQPDDVLIVRVSERYDRKTFDYIRNAAKSVCPENTRIMVIPDYIDLSVLTKSELDERTNYG